MPCYSPLKGFKTTNGALVFKQSGHTIGTMEVACGQCLGCRLDRTLMWAMRIVHEAALYQQNCFVTFTYRSKQESTLEQLTKGHHVPDDLSLNYHHFRDFIKRLRHHFKEKIRYFHCGEYGEQNLRPHYHACLFNCDFADSIVYQEREGIITYESKTLQNLWPYGFCTIGELNYETASYTAGYILKKITGTQSNEAYLRSDPYGCAYWVKPPYITMSLKPGIGKNFYEKYKTDFFPSDESPLPGSGKIIKKVPRYYQESFERSDPQSFELVKQHRAKWISEHQYDFTPSRLMDKYKCARARQSQYQREL